MELFSRKHKLDRPSVGLIHEQVPAGARRALLNLLSGRIGFMDTTSWMTVQNAVFLAPQVRRDFEFNVLAAYARDNIKAVVEQCQWYTILDVCELLAALFSLDVWKRAHPSLTMEIFEEAVNEIFADGSIGYELKNCRIEKLGAPYIDEVVSRVRQLLRNPQYAGPNEQFEKAIGFLNQRPNPDTANCVKDAIGAVEGLARIISGNEKLTLSKILEQEPFRSTISATLRAMMQKLYAFRGDAEGAAHGQTSVEQIQVEEAELALGISASCMIYLAKKFGEEP